VTILRHGIRPVIGERSDSAYASRSKLISLGKGLHSVSQNTDMTPSTTVLLIDDDTGDRESWAQRLNILSNDYHILEADTGERGLAIWDSQRIDCVVTELNLPDMTGFEIIVKLVPRVTHPEIAVIVLTDLTLPALAKLARNSGAHAYLQKSRTSGEDLDHAIRKAIATVDPNKKRGG
jgi:DNA-binding NarL/FixJ family response regulator